MGWSIGWDPNWKRDVGYGVPAYCDDPRCTTKIDRGMSYVCGGDVYGGEHGCGLHFCEKHLYFVYTPDGEDLLDANGENFPQMCARCVENHENPETETELYEPKPEHPEWARWKLTDESWQEWRDQNPNEVARLTWLASKKP